MRSLKGKRVLITAGPTREYIDPVRYISNDSSGKMGYALAAAAFKRGAEVTLISGPTAVLHPKGVKTVKVVSAREMRRAALKEARSADIIICAAAVSDFRPKKYTGKKIKKNERRAANNEQRLTLTQNPDILKEIGELKKPGKLLIGFALETENLIINAKKKLKDKNCDIMIANYHDSIGKDSGRIKIITKNRVIPMHGKKSTLAGKIMDIL